jgi:hypothetical protein
LFCVDCDFCKVENETLIWYNRKEILRRNHHGYENKRDYNCTFSTRKDISTRNGNCSMSDITCLDLFCGVGGLSCGLHMAGIKTVDEDL